MRDSVFFKYLITVESRNTWYLNYSHGATTWTPNFHYISRSTNTICENLVYGKCVKAQWIAIISNHAESKDLQYVCNLFASFIKSRQQQPSNLSRDIVLHLFKTIVLLVLWSHSDTSSCPSKWGTSFVMKLLPPLGW